MSQVLQDEVRRCLVQFALEEIRHQIESESLVLSSLALCYQASKSITHSDYSLCAALNIICALHLRDTIDQTTVTARYCRLIRKEVGMSFKLEEFPLALKLGKRFALGQVQGFINACTSEGV